MSDHTRVALDSIHCRAICDEIGEQLRFSNLRTLTELPTRLRELLDRLREQELEDTPLIAPSIAELCYGASVDRELTEN
jgi:hypothetical protein